MEDIGGGAAHVEADQGPAGQTGGAGHGHRPHQTAGGSREDRVLGEQAGGGLENAGGGHHPHPGGAAELPLNPGQIGLQHRSHRSLHQGGLQARNQTGQAAHPMREQHGPEAECFQPGAEGQLMGGVDDRVQQGDSTAAQAIGMGAAQLELESLIGDEGLQFGAIGGEAAGHLQHPVGQRLGPLDLQRKDVGAVLLADA